MPAYNLAVNLGSGQRRFDTAEGWVNADCVSRPPDQVPDVIMNALDLWPWNDGEVDMVAMVHTWEHYHLTEGEKVMAEAYRVLRPGGSVVVIVPDLRALAQRWLTRQISDYIFMVNCYGAWQSEPGDDHHWGHSQESLLRRLKEACPWKEVKPFDYRDIPGSSFPRDWWMATAEAIK